MLRLSCLALLLAGCLTHLAPRSRAHQAIDWQTEYEAARVRAMQLQRPILVVLAAGERDGLC
jgi:hypothetical protein